jgi:ferrochelatase
MENNHLAPEKIGVVLMTYGSATTSDHVSEYMEHIYHDNVPAGVVEDFEERYRLVGHSPLIEITEKQAAHLENFLNLNGRDKQYIVRAGMLHSKPFIEDALRDCRNAGAQKCIGIILSPQFSSFIMEGYRTAFSRAGEKAGFKAEALTVVGAWPDEPEFVALLADRVRSSVTEVKDVYNSELSIVFTTHSLPKRVVEKDPSYLDQIQTTIDAVVRQLGDVSFDRYSGYQSAGHTPEEWLKPDLTDILEIVRSKGGDAVLIVPVQFLTDHLEVLYDLDIAARQQCMDRGIRYHRIALPNADPRFIKALANLVEKT